MGYRRATPSNTPTMVEDAHLGTLANNSVPPLLRLLLCAELHQERSERSANVTAMAVASSCMETSKRIDDSGMEIFSNLRIINILSSDVVLCVPGIAFSLSDNCGVVGMEDSASSSFTSSGDHSQQHRKDERPTMMPARSTLRKHAMKNSLFGQNCSLVVPVEQIPRCGL